MIDWSTFPATSARLEQWARQVILWVKQQQASQDVVILPEFSKTNLPKAPRAGYVIYVPDEVGGEVSAVSDSAGQFRRTTDRAVVS